MLVADRDAESNGGPNGIRTRVSTSPQAFASESMTCGVLSQRGLGRDGNPEAVSCLRALISKALMADGFVGAVFQAGLPKVAR
jgi:hypothetical protein